MDLIFLLQSKKTISEKNIYENIFFKLSKLQFCFFKTFSEKCLNNFNWNVHTEKSDGGKHSKCKTAGKIVQVMSIWKQDFITAIIKQP